MLRMIGNSKTAETIAMMSVKYIDREITLISKHEVSKCTACPVLDWTLRSRRGGANVMNSYEK